MTALALRVGEIAHLLGPAGAIIPTVLAAGAVDPTAALTVYGPIGIVAVLLMLGWLVPKYAYDRVVVENDRLKTLVEATTPLIAKNSEVTAEAIALIHLLQAERVGRRPREPGR